MKLLLKKILIFTILISTISLKSQELNSKKGYDTQTGVMVYMLEKLKSNVIASTRGLNQFETDFQFDEKANSIGAIILHLAYVESHYQKKSFGEKIHDAYEEEEKRLLKIGFDLDKSKELLKGKPINYYLRIYKKVRKNTLEGFKKIKDDWWTKEKHWAWFHVMEHQAHHMGQIKLIIARFPE